MKRAKGVSHPMFCAALHHNSVITDRQYLKREHIADSPRRNLMEGCDPCFDFLPCHSSRTPASSQMARTLGTLLGSGVTLVEATAIVSDIMSNVYFKEAMKDASDQVSIGMPLSRPLEDCRLFPPMVYHMLRIGEESGNTEEMLDKLADYYDEEVEMAVQALMAAMEPMIIVVLAVVVGGLVGACMAPMLSMYTALDTM